MPMIAVLMALFGLMVAIPFSGGLAPSLSPPYDELADRRTAQAEAFATAAWNAARVQSSGMISRASMQLPSGFLDSTSWPLRAWSDGTFVYVWSGDTDPRAQRTSAAFPGAAPATVQVGRSSAGSIIWRDGTSSPRPAPVGLGCLVIRISLV